MTIAVTLSSLFLAILVGCVFLLIWAWKRTKSIFVRFMIALGWFFLLCSIYIVGTFLLFNLDFPIHLLPGMQKMGALFGLEQDKMIAVPRLTALSTAYSLVVTGISLYQKEGRTESGSK